MKSIFYSLSFKVFLIWTVCLALPTYGMFRYVKFSYEQHIQDELSNKIIQSISKGEQEIYNAFQSMANISSILATDQRVTFLLENPQESRYDRTLSFDNAVRNIEINNLYSITDMKVTLIDLQGELFSNWELNYNDYSFLQNEDWVRESMALKGHIVWSMFSPGYQIVPGNQNQGDKYVSLARSVLSSGFFGERIGTLVISIDQSSLGKILEKFSYVPSDSAYICIEDGETLLKNESTDKIPQELIRQNVEKAAGKDVGSLRCSAGGQEYLVSYYSISKPWTFDGQRLKVYHYTNYESVSREMNRLSAKINLAMLWFIGILVLLMLFLSVHLVKPIRDLDRQMRAYSIDQELTGLALNRKDEIGHLNWAFLKMSGRIRELFRNLNHEHEVREKYQFEALRAQVNPHFLFNTLTMIRYMAIVRKADNIVDSIDALANMLKYSMRRGGELISLEEELDNIRSYVLIQNYRFGDRYQVKIQVEEELLSLRVIKFILQPVVENAVIHGFEQESGTIWIYGEIDGDVLRLYVEDNGKGMDTDPLVDSETGAEEHRDEKKLTGIGLRNVNERIQVAYGEACGIQVKSVLGKGTTVAYALPVLREEELEEDHDR